MYLVFDVMRARTSVRESFHAFAGQIGRGMVGVGWGGVDYSHAVTDLIRRAVDRNRAYVDALVPRRPSALP